MKNKVKGSIAETKPHWIREYDFDSLRGHGFKKNSLKISLNMRIASLEHPCPREF